MKVWLSMCHWTPWCSESKECLCKVCVLRDGVHRLQSLYICHHAKVNNWLHPVAAFNPGGKQLLLFADKKLPAAFNPGGKQPLVFAHKKLPYILKCNPHPFYSFRGLKYRMWIRIACGLDSRSWAGFSKNDRVAVRAVRIIQYNNLLFIILYNI